MGITSLGAYSPLGYELTFLTEWHCQLLRAYYHNHIRQNKTEKVFEKELSLWVYDTKPMCKEYHNIITLLYMLEMSNMLENRKIVRISIL